MTFKTVSNRNRLLGVAALAAAVALMAPANAGTTYSAPYETGPQGGDSSNHIQVDPATGRITVLRANLTPGAVACGGSGPSSYLRIHAVGPASTVTASYTEAAIDPYTWVKVLVKDAAANFLAPAAIDRGPIVGDGSLTVALSPAIAEGVPFTVDFGLEAASACPNVDGGTLRFTGVAVG
jgi:hypothetical protein